MKKPSRDQIVEDWRNVVRPLIEQGKTTQEGVSARLTELAGHSIDQSNVSKWLSNVTPQAATIPAILTMTKQVDEGAWPNTGSRPVATNRHPALERLDPDEEFWIRYDAIEGRGDLSNEEKDRKADILAASIRAMAYRWDAKASEMRMRAMGTERTRRAEPPSGVNPPTRNARTVAPSGQPTRRKTGSGST